MAAMHVTIEQVLKAYIRTGLKPLHGAGAFAIDADERDLRDAMYDDSPQIEAVAACPIGVLCIDQGIPAHQVETGSFGEHHYNQETHEGNICWTDGFIAAWEENNSGDSFHPERHSYSLKENPDGLALYGQGYANGQMIRQGFINLGLRVV